MKEDVKITKICEICKVEKLITSFTVYGRKQYRRKMCKVCVNSGLKLSDAPIPKQTKLCIACLTSKTVNEFYRNNANEDGYEKRCRLCKKNNVSSRVRQESKPKPKMYSDDFLPTLVGITPQDFKQTYLFLQRIGYDLNKNIHEQFCEKFNLPVNKEPYKTKYHFSPKDLGLT